MSLILPHKHKLIHTTPKLYGLNTLGIIASSGGSKSLLAVLTALGLTANLKLCLDAGDAASYTSGQSWLDTSGLGTDFFLGTTGSVNTDDPTFNGTPGSLSSNEYFSFDGGDVFRYDSANDAWMNNIHKDNARFTIFAWVQFGALGTQVALCGTHGPIGGGPVGFGFFKTGTENLRCQVLFGGGSAFTNQSTAVVAAANAWTFIAISLNEATGANGAFYQIDGTQDLVNSTYTTPSAAAAANVLEIGSRGALDNILPNTSRIGMFGAYEGTNLTQANLSAIYTNTRGRYGV